MPCNPDSMPVHCAEAFGELAGEIREMRGETRASLRRIETQTARINGHVGELFDRTETNARNIAVLQEQTGETKASRARWFDRIWKLAAAIALMITGAILTAI